MSHRESQAGKMIEEGKVRYQHIIPFKIELNFKL